MTTRTFSLDEDIFSRLSIFWEISRAVREESPIMVDNPDVVVHLLHLLPDGNDMLRLECENLITHVYNMEDELEAD